MRCAIAAGQELLDPNSCRAFLVRRMHPGGPRCPGCGVSLVGQQGETFIAGGRVHCHDCGRWFTYRTGTPFQGTVASDQQLCLFALLCASGCSVPAIAEACRLSQDTIRRLRHRVSE